MDFSDVVKSLAPTVAGILGGPLAGIGVKFLMDKVGASAETKEAVGAAVEGLGQTAEGRIKLAAIDAELKAHALDIGLSEDQLSVQVIQAVNATMQSETKAEHWPTYSWRPFIGFVFGSMMLGVYFVLPLASIVPPVIPSEAWLAMGGILGAASWFRGKMQAG